jgi:Zn/Cd-binding protein ZinT
MKITKFVVKVTRQRSDIPEYVQYIDRTPIVTTKNRKLALVMGRFTAEDIVDSLQHHSRSIPELVSVEVRVG